jgi:hypothetical protein
MNSGGVSLHTEIKPQDSLPLVYLVRISLCICIMALHDYVFKLVKGRGGDKEGQKFCRACVQKIVATSAKRPSTSEPETNCKASSYMIYIVGLEICCLVVFYLHTNLL